MSGNLCELSVVFFGADLSIGLKKLGLFKLNGGIIYGSHDPVPTSAPGKVRFAQMAASVALSLRYRSQTSRTDAKANIAQMLRDRRRVS